jgi:hypothetical protein
LFVLFCFLFCFCFFVFVFLFFRRARAWDTGRDKIDNAASRAGPSAVAATADARRKAAELNRDKSAAAPAEVEPLGGQDRERRRSSDDSYSWASNEDVAIEMGETAGLTRGNSASRSPASGAASSPAASPESKRRAEDSYSYSDF